MGSFMFSIISIYQILLITSSFLGIGGLYEGRNLIYGFSNLIRVLYVTFSGIGLVFSLSSCHSSLRVLAKAVRREMLDMESGREKEEVADLALVCCESMS